MIRIPRTAGAALVAAALVAAGGSASAEELAVAGPCTNPQTVNLRTGQVVWSSWYGNQTNPVQTITPHPSWVPNTAAKWINDGRAMSTGLGTGGGVEDAGATLGGTSTVAEDVVTAAPSTNTVAVYRYSTSFWVDAASGTVNVKYAADNAVQLYLNNTLVGGYTPAGGQNGTNSALVKAFNQWHTLNAAGVKQGWNTLEARVTNYHDVTGVIVDGVARYCGKDIDVSTGSTGVEGVGSTQLAACLEPAESCTKVSIG